MLELTVPWEDCVEKAFERKLAKYEGLLQTRQLEGKDLWPESPAHWALKDRGGEV